MPAIVVKSELKANQGIMLELQVQVEVKKEVESMRCCTSFGRLHLITEIDRNLVGKYWFSNKCLLELVQFRRTKSYRIVHT